MRQFLAAVLFALCVAPAAQAQTVNVDFDAKFDFSKIKTFSIQVGTSSGNPLADKRVLDEVGSELTGKGWTMADAAVADATVMLHAATETKHSLSTMYTGMGGYRFGGMGSSQTVAQDYTVGTLVVDIFDAKTKALIFRGTAQDEMSSKTEKNQKKVDKATDKMFKNFPPGSAAK